jgi:general secretion pathway protein G
MNNKNGFTLIELLVTMGIIAVLTGMAVFNFNQSRMRARDVSRKSDLGQLVKALELYKNDHGSYPEDPVYPLPDETNLQTELLSGTYIKTTFNDPKGAEWQNYRYITAGATDTRSYYLMTCLENTADNTRAVVDQCNKFQNYAGEGAECKCGGTDIPNYPGVMYVVTNP